MPSSILRVRALQAASSQIVSIQWLRGLAALAVVAFHAGGPLGVVGAAGVDMFFIISGFVMWTATHQRRSAPLAFLKARLIRVVPLYWLMTLVLIAFVVTGVGFSSLQPTPGAVVSSFLFIPRFAPNGLIAPLLEPGWSLEYELFFYLIFAACLLIAAARTRLMVLCACFGGLVLVGLLLQPTGAIGRTYLNLRLLEFIVGGLIGYAWQTGRIGAGGRGVASVGLAALVALAATHRIGLAGLDGWEWLAWGGPSAVIVLAALMFEERVRACSSAAARLAMAAGAASYSIYLTHAFVLAILAKLAGKVGVLQGTVSFMLVGLVASGIVGWLTYRFIEQPLLSACRRWTTRAPRAASLRAASTTLTGPRAGMPSRR